MLVTFGFANADDKKAKLSYYYLDGWPLCAKITVIVNDLKKEYGDKITIETVKVGTGNSAEEIKKAGLKVHGIVGKDASGKIVETVDGHMYGKRKVKGVMVKLSAL